VPDAQIHPTGVEPTPARYLVPQSAELLLKGVFAKFDGSGAAGDFQPLLRIISDAGSTSIEAVSDTTVAAGASADVTWFPRVGGVATATSSTTVAVAKAYRDSLGGGVDPVQPVNANSNANGAFPNASTTDAAVMFWSTTILQNDTLNLASGGTYLCWVTTHWDVVDLGLASILMEPHGYGFPHTPWEPEKLPRFGDAVGAADNMDVNVLHTAGGSTTLRVSHSNNLAAGHAVQQCYFTAVYLATG